MAFLLAPYIAAGGSIQSSHPSGGWASALLLMGTLAVGFMISIRIVLWIASRTELDQWLSDVLDEDRDHSRR